MWSTKGFPCSRFASSFQTCAHYQMDTWDEILRHSSVSPSFPQKTMTYFALCLPLLLHFTPNSEFFLFDATDQPSLSIIDHSFVVVSWHLSVSLWKSFVFPCSCCISLLLFLHFLQPQKKVVVSSFSIYFFGFVLVAVLQQGSFFKFSLFVLWALCVFLWFIAWTIVFTKVAYCLFVVLWHFSVIAS